STRRAPSWCPVSPRVGRSARTGSHNTLKLRNAKFSDGSDLTADDVVFSFTRIRDDKGSLWADPFKVMDTVEATDPKTVTIKLKQATAPFLATLAFPIASVLSNK